MTTDHAADAAQWMRDNPGVVDTFLNLARKARNSGATKIGAKFLAERVRWEYHVERRDRDSFKINNNHIAYLARRLVDMDPSLHGLFEFRQARA